MITIKQLEALDGLVQTGSLGSAAHQLHTTESAVSKRLRELESALDTKVLERRGRKLVLTVKGKAIHRLGVELLERRNAIKEVASSPDYVGYNFRLGMTELIANTWLTVLVDSIRSEYPQLTLEPRIGLSLDLLHDLKAGQLDLAVVPIDPEAKRLACTPLFVSKNVWVCGASFEDTGRRHLKPADLAKLTLILQHNNSVLHNTVRQWFFDNDCVPSKVITCNSLKGVKDLAMAGFGIAYLPEQFCSDEIEAGALHALQVRLDMPSRTYNAIYRSQATETLAPRLADIIKAALARQP